MKIFCTYDKVVTDFITDSVGGARYVGNRINIFYKLSYDLYALSSVNLSILKVTHINFDNYLLWFGGVNAITKEIEWIHKSDKILYMDSDYEAVGKKKSYMEALE
jgi:hypothetical protein